MSSTQKTLAAAGIAVVVAVALYLFFTNSVDPPIIVGDGSVTFHSDKIAKKSDTELEVLKFFHKVRSITVVDTSGATAPSTIDLKKGQDWTLTSASGVVSFSTDPQLGVQAGVKGNCPTPWQGGGLDYTCVPADGSKLTPATLKIEGENCPGTGQPTCTLGSASGKFNILLDYK